MLGKENISELDEKFTYMYVGYSLGAGIGALLFSNDTDFFNVVMTIIGAGIGGTIGYFFNNIVISLLAPPSFAVVFNNYFAPEKTNGFYFEMKEVSEITRTMQENRNLVFQLNYRLGI